MAKISSLPAFEPGTLDGTETVPVVKDGNTGRSTLGALAQPVIDATALLRDQAADLVQTANVFVGADLAAARAAGEAATAEGTYFKAVGQAEGLVEVRKRTSEGSDLLYGETTTAALASASPSLGSQLIKWIRDAGNAVALSVRKKLSERVTPLDFGAAGDADPDDNTAGTDDTDAVQAAFDFCAEHPGYALSLAGRYYKVQWVRIPARPDRRRWFVYGEGGGFVNPATSATEAPCLFHSSLANSGDASRTYAYTTGVTLDGVNFHGSGYGVGYMHAIAGQLHLNECSFQKLEDGLLTIGVAGMSARDCTFDQCVRAVHAAKNAEYAWTAGYTAETSTGWNDGYFLDGGYFRMNTYGLLYKGSDNEGVVGVRGMVWTGALESYVETYGNMKAVEVAGNWCEYTRAAADGSGHADIIRFWRGTGADSGGESPARFTVRHNHFFLSSPNEVNGKATYAVRRVIDARVNCHVHDNVFSAHGAAVYECIIYNNHGSNGTAIPHVTVTPAAVASFNSEGRISFNDDDLAELGGKESIFYMVHDDGKTYALTRYGTGAEGTSSYNVHAVSYVYSPQFAAVNDSWEIATNQKARAALIGVVIDFNTNVTGLTAPVGDVMVLPGMNGGLVNMVTGAGLGGLIQIERNVCQNIDMRRFYAQREFGRYIMRDNIKRT